ncbi:Fosmidomycin resistance protein [Achromobacter xylosoxidans]|uniref:MFS transporter n=1 Tax=Alcaligenes xylosoxydans xylosoxydans TaxID=85698 RepID=UPI0012A8E096|nr:Fosmidomycin resistance protein [Achromobacter xylosoxidans]
MSLTANSGTVAASHVASAPRDDRHQQFVVGIVGAVALAHLFNDLIGAILPAIYPMLKENYTLSFAQIGWISMVYQITASLFQPWIGLYTDKNPKPFLLPCGMVVTLGGLVLLTYAASYPMLLVSSALIGFGSSTFHPEASRVARMASGGRFGTAQSAFQVGGSTGSALGPLLAAAIIIPRGQGAVAWFLLAALAAIGVLARVTQWRLRQPVFHGRGAGSLNVSPLHRGKLVQAIAVVSLLMFAKFVYTAGLSNYFTFYLIERFGVSVQTAQYYLFAFLASVAVGTFVGGPIGDRIGRKAVIWVSFLGVAPFALMLPYADLFWSAVLVVIIGLVLSSAFSTLVVYAQEAVPGRVGMVAGMMFGLMFGISGIASAGLGFLADSHGLAWVYKFCSFLPLIGLATALLPDTRNIK